MTRRSFLAELKRRHVYKVGAAYAVGGWLLVQVATQVFPFFDVPNVWVRGLIIFVATGFPVAIALSWVFDLTSEGIVRTDDATEAVSASIAQARPGIDRKLNYVLATLLLLALGYVVAERFLSPSREAGAVATVAAAMPSIAVLAFTDMSEAGNQGYFADGISEELLNLLARVPQLHVVGRTSSFSFKGKSTSIKEIGKALDATSILEGGVRKVGDSLRVTARLINVADGYELWSQAYDRKLTDIFAVQDDIAGAVVDALRFKLLPAERPSTSRQHVPGFETYDQFLIGRQFLLRNDDTLFVKAVEAFRRAIELDPEYADAYAGLAMAESFVVEQERNEGLRDAGRRRAMEAANRAVLLGPSLGDAYASRGYLRATNDWDWPGALTDLRKAIALDPADARNQLRYGYLLATLGRLDDASAALTECISRDPLFTPGWYWMGRILIAQGDYAGAVHALNRTLAISPDYHSASASLGQVALLQGDAAKARQIYAAEDRPLGIAVADHALGDEAAAQAGLKAFVDEHAIDSAYLIASAYAWLGQSDPAFAWLDRAIVQRDQSLNYVKYDPLLRSIRSDPRYREVLRKLRLDD